MKELSKPLRPVLWRNKELQPARDFLPACFCMGRYLGLEPIFHRCHALSLRYVTGTSANHNSPCLALFLLCLFSLGSITCYSSIYTQSHQAHATPVTFTEVPNPTKHKHTHHFYPSPLLSLVSYKFSALGEVRHRSRSWRSSKKIKKESCPCEVVNQGTSGTPTPLFLTRVAMSCDVIICKPYWSLGQWRHVG